ncbi:translocation/assembly module TamB domain-containing protein [Sphingomonas sp. BIUV-7]|uniref:Translocation/assembly module TamB domain-containing protein n=1 Tax=Sphingomonas natans TaxID=3063330 RepID=A0ABT8YDA3_9SPHN|nr:translocation/assembly module TamB [Sphingomonas sp. BIUV-7]MDO6416360.1 translocation/assembly module TamB domain-containing protein [Sphingomonas sp. BIUV-7]
MELDTETIETDASPKRPNRLLRAIAWALAGLVAVVGVAIWSVDTGPGHRLIVDRIAALKIKTGLRIRIGRIEGSIWNHAVLRDVRLYDLRGQFFEAPAIRLDWHPLGWLANRLDIDTLSSDLVTLDRLPKLRSTKQGPILPGFDIRIGKLEIAHLRLGKAVAGTAAEARVAARAEIHGRRAMIWVQTASNKRDRLAIDLDAEPDGDRFRLAAHAEGPAGGVLGGLFGTKLPILASVDGRGTWHRWHGAAHARLDARSIADLALTVKDGDYGLTGRLAPSPFLKGKLQRLTAPAVSVAGHARLADRQLTGDLALSAPALRLATRGRLDLAESAFRAFALDVELRQPSALFPNMTGREVRLHTVLDGDFREPAFRYALTSPHIAFDQTGFDRISAVGSGRFGKVPVLVPITLSAARVTGIGDVAGGILANLKVKGTLAVDAKTVTGAGLLLSSDKLNGKLGLRLDLASGAYDVALTGGLRRYLIPGLGIVDVDSVLSVVPGPGGRGTVVSGRGTADVRRFDNAFLRSLAGGLPHLGAKLIRDPDGTLRFQNLVLTGPAIRITGSGLRRRDGTFKFDGTGRQDSYGTFRIGLDGAIDHPKVDLVLDAPVPALGTTDVRLNLDPVPNGFDFRAAGGSYLGPFTANGVIDTSPNQPTVIDVRALDVSGTRASGRLRSDPNGFSGRLDVAGGGITGALQFAPQGTIQRIDPHLTFAGAKLAAATPIAIGRGQLDGTILLDSAGVGIDGSFAGRGLRRGAVSIARLAEEAHLRGGRGTVAGTIVGSRGKTFDLKFGATLDPGRAAITASGNLDAKPIRLPEPAIITAQGDGWRLASARLDYAGGTARIGGEFGPGRVVLDSTLDRMPLILADIFVPKLGLSGYASGKLSFRREGAAAPTGRMDLTLRGLARAGLVLVSQPIDVGLAAALTPSGIAARAVAISQGKTIGRAQARIAPLPPGGDLSDRILRAPLFAQLRYIGPADILWRLTGVETIDLSGPLTVTADAAGTLADPLIRGSLRTDAGRVESSVTGTVVRSVKATGTFEGSRLLLSAMSGVTPDGGTVTGRGDFDLSGATGVAMNLSLVAKDAQILNRDDIGATVTGPITIRSDGRSGVISGDVVLEKSRYQLGSAAAAQVAQLNVTDLNADDEDFGDALPAAAWQLDLKARARNRVMVRGLGLDSEWRADLTIKGAVNNPVIGGKADLVRGGYQFAGRRFELERGTIRFTGAAPPDPILDITARADIQGLNASIQVSGTGLRPEISFQSVPALPEDELLSRLLFGTSITNLSAPEALQLAAAVASLRSSGTGGGLNLDPINAVRRAVRLDRLRILPADPTTGAKSAVAAGKYLGRRTYVEVVTDGAGYSATSVEFRITRWLSLLSTISTIGRQSANVRVSKDY